MCADLLKAELQRLASQWPHETLELLCRFQMFDQPDKQVDLCELVLSLKELDMLPCLPFHLNTFEAIKLFRQLLCGLEYRQKLAFPTYYSDMQREKDSLKSAAGTIYLSDYRTDYSFLDAWTQRRRRRTPAATRRSWRRPKRRWVVFIS